MRGNLFIQFIRREGVLITLYLGLL